MTAPTAAPPRVRTSPATYRSLLDRRRSIALFERIAGHQHDVVEFRPGGRRIWLVNSPALSRQVLVDAGRSVTKGEGLRLVRWVLGDGLLTLTDPTEHRRRRRMIQPAFRAARLAEYAEVMVAAAHRASERWHAGDVVDMPDEMARITLDVVGRTLLGDDTDSDARAVTDALDVVLKRFGMGFLPGGERLVMRSQLPMAVRVRDAIAAMRSTVDRIVLRHHTRPDGDAEAGTDIVGDLLAARDEEDPGASLDDEQVRNETLTLLLAGFETTANALAWAWWLLDAEPRAAAALRAELSSVLSGDDPSYDDLTRLPYATAVIAETMRLRPPAWMLEREVLEPVVLDGFTAPPGTTLLTSPWLLHHDRRWWGDDAAVFRPERWLGADGSFDPAAPGQPRGAYVPFGAGSRICIGESFAWAEAVLVLAVLAQRWTPVTEPGQQVGTWAAVTLRPHPGIRMRLSRT